MTGYDSHSLPMNFHHFGDCLPLRPGGSATIMLFYENKLFQGQFISVVPSNPKGHHSYLVVESVQHPSIAGGGIIPRPSLIDNRLYGRKMMQQAGFFVCFITFII